MGLLEIGLAPSLVSVAFVSEDYKQLTELIARNEHWQSLILDPTDKSKEGRSVIDNPTTKEHLFWKTISEWLFNEVHESLPTQNISQQSIPVKVMGHADEPYTINLNKQIYEQAVQILGGGDEAALWSKIDSYILTLTVRLQQSEKNQDARAKHHNKRRALMKQMVVVNRTPKPTVGRRTTPPENNRAV